MQRFVNISVLWANRYISGSKFENNISNDSFDRLLHSIFGWLFWVVEFKPKINLFTVFISFRETIWSRNRNRTWNISNIFITFTNNFGFFEMMQPNMLYVYISFGKRAFSENSFCEFIFSIPCIEHFHSDNEAHESDAAAIKWWKLPNSVVNAHWHRGLLLAFGIWNVEMIIKMKRLPRVYRDITALSCKYHHKSSLKYEPIACTPFEN